MADNTPEPTPGDNGGQQTIEPTKGVTFTPEQQEYLNKLVGDARKDGRESERKKISEKKAEYEALKAKAAKLDEIEKAKLSDEEKAQARLKELQDEIAKKDKELSERTTRDLKRAKIEQAIADGKMKLPKGRTIDSLVKRMIGGTEQEIDVDLIELMGLFPPEEPSKGIGGGSQQPPAKAPELKEQIAALEIQASKETDPIKRDQLQTQILGLKMRAGGFVIA